MELLQDDRGASVRKRFPNTPLSLLNKLVQLHDAVDEMAAAYPGPELDKACDRFSTSARSFAAQVLEERIRRRFSTMIDESTGKPKHTTPAEKTQCAREIRGWLLPWNLGFQKPGTDEVYQLYASANGTNKPMGIFSVTLYGSYPQKKTAAWSEIKELVENCRLVDALQPRERDVGLGR